MFAYQRVSYYKRMAQSLIQFFLILPHRGVFTLW